MVEVSGFFWNQVYQQLTSCYNYNMPKIMKTEHTGAKNGGGYWGTRAAAKQISKKRRRLIEKKHVRDLFRSVSKKIPGFRT